MKPFTLCLLLAAALAAQGTPNCQQSLTFTAAGTGTAINTISGAQAGCAGWRLTWSVTGFTAVTIQIEGSQDNASWSAFFGSLVIEGNNPTSWTASTASNTVVVRASRPYIRVNVAGVTGTGTVITTLFGYSGTSAQMDNGGSGGPVSFDQIQSGTNASASMHVGTGASLDSTGTGTLTANGIRSYTVAALPSSPATGQQGYVTDGATSSDCTVGLGTAKVLCGYNGTAWAAEGGGGAPAFSAILAGTNTSAAMTVGTGASLRTSGTGTIDANRVNGAAVPASATLLASNASGQLVAASASGGPVIGYSRDLVTFAATEYFPAAGGALPSAKESDVVAVAPTALTVSNFTASLSAAPGTGNSLALTWRKNSVSQTVTCTISGSDTTCSDTTHSFTVAAGDIIDVEAVPGGTVAGTSTLAFLASTGSGSGGGSGPLSVDLLSPDKSIMGGTPKSAKGKAVSLASGSTQTLLSYSGGPGYTTNFWLGIGGLANSGLTCQYVIVTVTVDGTVIFQGTESSFFGAFYWTDAQSGGGLAPIIFQNQWLQEYGGQQTLIPIPFSNSIEISLTNQYTGAIQLWWTASYVTGVPNTWPRTSHLHVAVVSENETGLALSQDQVGTLLDATGLSRGRLLGIDLLFDGYACNNASYLEGAVDIYTDGALALKTSGTEDYFGMSGYFGSVSQGAGPQFDTYYLTKNKTGVYSLFAAVRFHVLDPVLFENALKIQWHAGDSSSGFTFTGTVHLFYAVWYYTE